MKLSKSIYVLLEIFENAKKVLKIAWEMDKRLTFAYYATATIGSIAPVLASVSMKYLIDFLQNSQRSVTATVPTIILLTLATYYFISIMEDIIFYGLNYSYFDYLFRYKMQNEVGQRYYQSVAKLDIAHYEDTKTQDLITKTRDTMLWRVPDFLRHLRDLLSNIVTYVSAFIVLLPFGLWIPVIITIVTIPRIFLRAKHGALQWSIYGSGAPQARKLWYMGYLLNDAKSVKEMRIFQSTNALLERYKGIQNSLYELNKKPLDKYLRVRNIPILIETLTIFLVANHFLPSALANVLTIGNFTLLITLMGRLNANAASSAQRLGELYENNLYVNHYFETITLPRLVKEAKNPHIFKKIVPPVIEFKNVSFSYQDGPEVISDVSFTINAGESVAFVGENGAGKSTIVKLLCRFYDVTDGSISINGINLKKIKLSNWYKFLGTLFQEFTHYHFTIKDNIVLGNPKKLNEKEIVESAKKSGAHEFIEKLPNKYDQMLGREFEDGEELSGGQWQKLAIARAFYQEPPVLILDEPTSAIDAEAEYEIFSNLQKQYKNKTLILVSHRFSTVRNANKIIVISEGKIVEQGNHKELLEKKGKYYRMFSTQAKGYK